MAAAGASSASGEGVPHRAAALEIGLGRVDPRAAPAARRAGPPRAARAPDAAEPLVVFDRVVDDGLIREPGFFQQLHRGHRHFFFGGNSDSSFLASPESGAFISMTSVHSVNDTGAKLGVARPGGIGLAQRVKRSPRAQRTAATDPRTGPAEAGHYVRSHRHQSAVSPGFNSNT